MIATPDARVDILLKKFCIEINQLLELVEICKGSQHLVGPLPRAARSGFFGVSGMPSPRICESDETDAITESQ